MSMYHIIITLFLYSHSLISSQDPEKKELSPLTFSEIKNGFFEEVKKSKYKNLGLSIGTGVLTFGATRLLGKKYQIFQKYGATIGSLFSLLPLTIQGLAYYYYGKKSQLTNNSLFPQLYDDVLKKKNKLCELYKLKLPPVPDEGIAGNEEKPIEQKDDNEAIAIKTDAYFDFNIDGLKLDQFFSDNLSILIFYLLEINEEKKLETYAGKLIEKMKSLIKDIEQEAINKFLLEDMISLLGRYRQAHKEEKLTKFFIFPLAKNIEKNKALELMNEFITKNLRSTSDIVKDNTFKFLQNNNISPEEIKINFLNSKHQQEKNRYEILLNKDWWNWLFQRRINYEK